MNLVNKIKNIIISFYKTFFPRQCIFCKEVLIDNEDIICDKCAKQYRCKQIDLNDEEFMPLNNIVQDMYIWSYYSYSKRAILEFKFQKNVYLGIQLSKLMARSLKNVSWISSIDYIVPIPLHRIRERERGFNQAEIIAQTLGKELNIEVVNDNLKRIKNNKPQHTSSSTERYENVKNIFEMKDKNMFNNKNILLVDDIITTCSTIKSCCQVIKENNNTMIYIACLASDRCS